MKNDKVLMAVQWFFRLASWFMIFAAVCMVLYMLFLHFDPQKVLKGIAYEATTVPGGFFVTLGLLTVSIVCVFLVYRSLWRLFRVLREKRQVCEEVIGSLRWLAKLFLITFVLDILLYALLEYQVETLQPLLEMLGLYGLVINWGVFVFPGFTGVTALCMFFLCLFFVRFLRVHLELQEDVARLEAEQDLVV